MRTSRRLEKIREGDIFLVPSSGPGFYLGQIVSDTRQEIGAIFVYLYSLIIGEDGKFSECALDSQQVIAASLITAELIEGKAWKVIGSRPVPVHPAMASLVSMRAREYVGSVVVGSALVSEYLDTRYGRKPIADWPDPNYVTAFFERNLSGCQPI